MNLLRCQILGFGKLINASLSFQSGLNLVFAPNEGGKTTLQRVLIALLYGQLRSDLRTQRRLDSWVERYKPWQGTEYGGILWCRLANGRELEIHRMFGKEEARVEIRTASGEEISGDYEQQKNGDILFARSHLGLPKELFESVAVIRESRVAELNGRDALRDRIANLAQSGDEELSIRQSLDKLNQALEAVGSDRAPTKPYKQALDLLQSLTLEREALLKRREEFGAWIKERNDLAAKVAELEDELAEAGKGILAAKWREADGKVRALGEMEDEIDSLQLEIAGLGANLEFPVHNLDELNHRIGARESIEKRLADIRIAIQAAMAKLKQVVSERRGLEPYANLGAGAESEKITEWFVSYLSTSVQKDGFQKSLSNVLDEKNALIQNLDKLGPVLSAVGVDWEQKARAASEEERVVSQMSLSVTQKRSEAKAALEPTRRKCITQGLLSAGAIMIALAPFAVRLIREMAIIPSALDLSLSMVCLAIAALFFLNAGKARKSVREIVQNMAGYEEELARLHKKELEIRREIDQAMQDSGYKTLEEFLAAAKLAEQCRQRIPDIDVRLAELERQRDQAHRECGEFLGMLKETLARVGLSCSVGNVKSQIDVFRNGLRRFRELDAYFHSSTQHLDALKAEEEKLQGEIELQNVRINSILSEANMDNPEAFRDSCRKRQRALELLEREASRKREFQRLCANLTLEEWKNRLTDLEEMLRKSGADFVSKGQSGAQVVAAGKGAPFLPYQPGVEESEQKEKQIASKLSVAREGHARLVERVAQAFQSHRELSAIEEDLSMAEKSIRRLAVNRDALIVALETIKELSRQQQEVLAPQLNGSVERRFLPLTRDKYEEAKIDPEFRLWVRESGRGELRPADNLSRGTQDQLYFALRFGILDLIGDEHESSPCFLDEPFAAYDRTRLADAFNILREEAKRRQLLLFTCREDLRDLAAQQSANIIELPF